MPPGRAVVKPGPRTIILYNEPIIIYNVYLIIYILYNQYKEKIYKE
jgi:hypothetical protein